MSLREGKEGGLTVRVGVAKIEDVTIIDHGG
jgi:hypothetical protein